MRRFLFCDLFIIFVSGKFSGIEAEKFKFADDGSLLISADTKVELDGRTRTVLQKFFQWCTKWRLKLNIEETILDPINLVDGNLFSHNIGSEIVTVSDSCKILGIEIDSRLSFKPLAKNKKGRVQHHFQAMAKHAGLKWGLSPKTRIRLYIQIFRARILYAAPLWAWKNLCILDTLNGKIVKQELGVPISSSNCVAGVLAGIPPLDLHCEILRARFLKKVMQSNDH